MALVDKYASTREDTVSPEYSSRVEVPAGSTDLRALAERSIENICKMLDAGTMARQTRFEQIRKNEDMYNGFTPPALKGRSNIPIDCMVMGGFVDTLLANTNQPIDLTYLPTQERALKAAKRMTAVFKEESGPNKGNWDPQIQDSKLLAALSGRGFAKLFVESAPKFRTDFYIPDHYDMVTEPQGGGYLDRHLFKFEMNIFRSKKDMMDGMRAGFYNAGQVSKLIARYNDHDFKASDDAYRNKLARFASFGVDIEAESYVGQNLYRLTEGVVSLNGEWYYVLFSRETRTWVRFERLEDVFAWAKKYPGRGPWTSWATHRHPYIFWTKAPADDFRPIAYTMKKVLNLAIDNLEKRNWDMKLFDPRIITDPSQLLWKQDGLVKATLRQGQRLQDGLFSIQTPDTASITMNLMQFLESYAGKKTGVGDEVQGDSNEKVLGIQVNNIQQVSKRMTFANEQFAQMYNDLGCMFDWGVWEHLREDYAIKLVGADGAADWDEVFTRDDAEMEYKIQVRSGVMAEEQNAIRAAKREKFYANILNNPALAGKVNAEAFVRSSGRDADIDEEELDLLLDPRNSADADVLADAAQVIEDAVEGKPLRIYRDANVAFIEKILNFARKHYQVIPTAELKKMTRTAQKDYADDMKEYDRLTAAITAHMPFVKQNAAAQAKLEAAAAVKAAAAAGGPQQGPDRMSPEAMAAMGGGGRGAPQGGPQGAVQPAPQPEQVAA